MTNVHTPFLPFSKPSIDQATIDAVAACLKSGWISTGPQVSTFTQALQHYFDAPYVIPLMSATAGLHLSLVAMGIQPGDEIITTPLTFAATINTIVLAGGTPILIDIDPNTYNLNIELLERAITARTRVILPVHFAGLPVDLDPIYTLAKQHRLRVLEDAAHAIGAKYKNKRIGSQGDTQVFSFHPNKNMTTGEGGCVVTRDRELAQMITRLHFHGFDQPILPLSRSCFNAAPFTTENRVQIPGYKHNMTDIQATLGIHQLQALPRFLARRLELAVRYQAILATRPQWKLPPTPSYSHTHAWHLYAPILNPSIAGMGRDQFRAAMRQQGIGTGVHYHAIHLHPYYCQTGLWKPGDFPQAETICSQIVSLPLFPDMSDADHDRVIYTMDAIFAHSS